MNPKSDQAGPRWPKWWYAVATLLLVAAAAAVLHFVPLRPAAQFTLEEPDTLTLTAGGDPVPVQIHVHRDEGNAAIRLTFADTPAAGAMSRKRP